MPDRKPPDALMFKEFAHFFVLFWPLAVDIDFWRKRGWSLLLDSRDVTFADLDDVRREDESRGRPNG